jgi:hypothetical protein
MIRMAKGQQAACASTVTTAATSCIRVLTSMLPPADQAQQMA